MQSKSQQTLGIFYLVPRTGKQWETGQLSIFILFNIAMVTQAIVENPNEILRKDYENDMVEVWQKFTLTPKPDLHGKTLNCSYVQVTQSDSTMYEHLNLR